MSKTATLRRRLRSHDQSAVAFPTQIVMRPLEALLPYARNARTHSPEQIAQIAASIVEFGFTNPCLITKNNRLIAGHGRVLAAEQLAMDEIPCIILAHFSDLQELAYRLTDNKLALNASWDNELLAEELDLLNDADFDIDLLGWNDDELGKLWDLGLGEGGDAPQQSSAATWAVIVECEDEASQVELIERLQGEGYTVRGSVG